MTALAARAGGISFALAALAAGSMADDVLLTNGAKYEDVVAHLEGDSVRIQLSTGSLTLPRTRVAKIHRGETVLAEFERRRAALEGDLGEGGGPWIELARWARRHGFASGERSAALRAAELEPELPGLGAILARHDYRFDERRQRFVAAVETPTTVPQAPRRAARAELDEELRRLTVERRIEDATAAAHTSPPARAAAVVVPVPIVPVFVVPWATLGAPLLPPPASPAPPTPPPYRGYQRLVGRQPGSFLPIDG